VLYAIQGTGNGHLSRAMEILPHLLRRADVDILLSGTQCELQLPYPVRYRFHGLSFVFGKNGGIDLHATYASNRFRRFLKEVNSIALEGYDLVISDFEPISAWACHLQSKTCVGLSNQAALLMGDVPMSDVLDPVGRFILANYAPVTRSYGFHFQRYNSRISTPIIRKEVRTIPVTDRGHYTVYLPAHDAENIISTLLLLPKVRWEVFSKRAKYAYQVDNVHVRPIEGRPFLESMASSSGVLSAAGFGTTSEALFLRKKLCVVPMSGQYEQCCNAEALSQMGVLTLPSLRRKHLPKLEEWLASESRLRVNYPDNADEVVAMILHDTVASASSAFDKMVLAGINVS
jgi:uncharacterized protein (TIGR00661 family)